MQSAMKTFKGQQGSLSSVVFLLIFAMLISGISFMVFNSLQRTSTHVTVVEDINVLPVFEIVSSHVFGTSHSRFDVEGTPILGFIQRGETTLTYSYSWHFSLGTENPVTPRLVGDIITLAKSDLEIGIIGEVAVFDFYEISTTTRGLFAYRQIPTEYAFYLIDRARADIKENLGNREEQMEYARQNMMDQLQAMYEALGFEVKWI